MVFLERYHFQNKKIGKAIKPNMKSFEAISDKPKNGKEFKKQTENMKAVKSNMKKKEGYKTEHAKFKKL